MIRSTQLLISELGALSNYQELDKYCDKATYGMRSKPITIRTGAEISSYDQPVTQTDRRIYHLTWGTFDATEFRLYIKRQVLVAATRCVKSQLQSGTRSTRPCEVKKSKVQDPPQ